MTQFPYFSGLFLMMTTILMTSCSLFRTSGDFVIPAEDTPRAQFAIAERQFRVARTSFDEEIRNEELAKSIRAYDAVISRFPNDPVYTPTAYIRKGDILRLLERHQEAIQVYRAASSRYATQPDIHALSLYGMALSMDESRRFREAKDVYSQIIDSYSNSSDPEIQPIVREAQARYRVIR